MKKTNKNVLIAFIGFIAVLCFSMSIILGFTAPAKAADTTFAVSSIKQTYVEPYNSAADGKGMRSNYVITFNQNIFDGTSYADGEDITSLIVSNVSFMDNFKFNGNTLTTIHSAEPVKFYKAGNNALELQTSRTVYWAKMEFVSGFTFNGKTISTDVTYYENQDWTFTALDTAPELKVMSVAERPYNDNAWSLVTVAFNGDVSGYTGAFNLITFTNASYANKLYNTEVHVGAGGNYLHGEKSYNNTALLLYFSNAEMGNANGVYTEINFSAGFRGIAKTQTFVVGSGVSHVDWANKPIWTEKEDVMKISSFENSSVQGSDETKFTLTLDSASDLFASVEVGADLGALLKENSNILSKIEINDIALSGISGITFKKVAANSLVMTIPTVMASANVTVLPGFKIGEMTAINKETFQLVVIEANTETEVVDITAETGYGTMGINTEVRFALRFSDLGMFDGVDYGTNLNAYLNKKFTDNVLLNGVSLSDISASGTPIAIYRGNKNNEIHTGNDNGIGKPYGTALKGKYDVSNAIEVVLGSSQIYDYDVTVKEGCVLGDVIVTETVKYQKQFDETFALVTDTTDVVKPIAIREIPYGAQANTRAFLVIFNNGVTLGSGVNLANLIEFSGKTISKTNGCMITKTNGANYINSEIRYAKRQYTLLLDSTEYTNFMLSENPTITIPSFALSNGGSTEAVKFELVKGTWFPEGADTDDYEAPAFVELLQHGNQGIDSYNPNTNSVNSKYGIEDYKLIRFVTNYGYNWYISGSFLKDNIYFNGKRIAEYGSYNSGIEKELKWESVAYSNWVSNNVRNYDTGFDVIYIPRGTIISGNRMIDHDTYVYSVRNTSVRDGAGNFAWDFFFEKPALKIYKGGEVSVDDQYITATVSFDRVVAKQDVKFGVYNSVDVSNSLYLNGKLISAYTGEQAFAWTDDGFTVKILKTELEDYETAGLNFKFAENFTTPYGYAFDGEETYSYSFENGIWNVDFETASIKLKENLPVSVSAISTVRAGDKEVSGQTVPKLAYKFSVNFDKDVAGVLKLEGNKAPAITIYRNITAPYSDLVKLTELGYNGNILGVGYEYHDYVIEKFIRYGVRDSILDNISLNGETVREILDKETAYVSLVNYPLQITLNGNSLEFIIQEDSVLYSKLMADGFTMSIGKKVVFEADSRTMINTGYKMEDGVFVEYVYTDGLSVVNTKNTYYKGEDLDLSKITAWLRLSTNVRGESVTVTANMISGYDKNQLGKQTVTVTYGDYSDTFTVNVIEEFTHSDIVIADDGGCGSSLGGNAVAVISALVMCAVVIICKRVKRA